MRRDKGRNKGRNGRQHTALKQLADPKASRYKKVRRKGHLEGETFTECGASVRPGGDGPLGRSERAGISGIQELPEAQEEAGKTGLSAFRGKAGRTLKAQKPEKKLEKRALSSRKADGKPGRFRKQEKGTLLSRAISRVRLYGTDPKALQKDQARMRKRINRLLTLISLLVRLYNAFSKERIYLDQ